MTAVVLPQVFNNVINLPPPPSQPPTDADVMTGVKFRETMRLAYGNSSLKLSNCNLYKYMTL